MAYQSYGSLFEWVLCGTKLFWRHKYTYQIHTYSHSLFSGVNVQGKCTSIQGLDTRNFQAKVKLNHLYAVNHRLLRQICTKCPQQELLLAVLVTTSTILRHQRGIKCTVVGTYLMVYVDCVVLSLTYVLLTLN